MRLLLSWVGVGLVLGGCTAGGPRVIAVSPSDKEGTIGKGSNVITVGGNVISAGGGNVISAGGGNVISAGGANALGKTADRAPVAAAPVAAAGAGNLIATGSAQVVSAGGMNLQSPSTPTAPGPGGPGGPGAPPPPPPGRVQGVVWGPGALIAQQAAVVPVGNTYVGVYDLAGTRLGEAVQANDKGEFTLAEVPSYRLLFLRSQFTYNGREYYLSTPFRLEGAEGRADLTPLSTTAEACLFTKIVVAPPDDAIGEAYMDAFWAATQGLQAKVPASALLVSATIDERASAYASLAQLHPGLFVNDIVAAVKRTSTTDPAGPPAPGGAAPSP